jgi:hypothetical protein
MAAFPSDGLPSGPVMFLAEVIADAIGQQATVQDERNGVWWIAGGCTPGTAGCKVNLRDVAEAVLVNLPDCGYGRLPKSEGK